MKSLTAKSAILLTALIAMPSFATVQFKSLNWNETSNNEVLIKYKPTYDKNEKFFIVSVSYSKGGEQRIYFNDSYYSDKNICKLDMLYDNKVNKYQTTTMIFNGQAVKMARFCNKSADSNQAYYLYTPQTDLIDNYVINLFKTSRTPIKVQFDDETLYVPVTGFTKAWNSAGGNAI